MEPPPLPPPGTCDSVLLTLLLLRRGATAKGLCVDRELERRYELRCAAATAAGSTDVRDELCAILALEQPAASRLAPGSSTFS